MSDAPDLSDEPLTEQSAAMAWIRGYHAYVEASPYSSGNFHNKKILEQWQQGWMQAKKDAQAGLGLATRLIRSEANE